MSVAAILGAGDLGGAIAYRLACRGRFREIRLIDADDKVAAGKALDIQQAGPIGRVETQLVGTADVLAAVGASAIILADTVSAGEWRGDEALALMRRLAEAGAPAPFVCAGPSQTLLLEAAARELRIPADRLLGTAASALAGAVRALLGLELDGSGTDVGATVTGRPPAFVIGWSSATVAGSLVSERVPAHRLLAIDRSLHAMWPPAAYAIAAATARVVEALVFGSRQLEQAVTILEGEFGVRRTAAMLPLVLGHGRVLRRVMPSLSRLEATAVETSIQRAAGA